jgi:hypothetical protein
MKRKALILTSCFLSGSIGFAQAVFAQSPGPSGPRPGPEMPGQPEPTIPGRPAPGLPQPEPFPGRPGTIPEQIQPPPRQDMVVSSEDVKKAQEALKAKGLDPGPANGRMDARTQEALRQFQKANDLPATGVLDEKTAAKLGVAMSGGKGTEPRQVPQEKTSSDVR